MVISLLIILGGLGFYVLYELILYKRGEIRRISTHTKLVFLLSKFPVGSSARITKGLFIKALAMATLCISPPCGHL